jgi:predicted transcriptional regulator
MLSFRVDDAEAASVQQWAERLGVDRSEVLREALRRHLVNLAAEQDIAAWTAIPPTSAESGFSQTEDWGPAEDWSDWAGAVANRGANEQR